MNQFDRSSGFPIADVFVTEGDNGEKIVTIHTPLQGESVMKWEEFQQFLKEIKHD